MAKHRLCLDGWLAAIQVQNQRNNRSVKRSPETTQTPDRAPFESVHDER